MLCSSLGHRYDTFSWQVKILEPNANPYQDDYNGVISSSKDLVSICSLCCDPNPDNVLVPDTMRIQKQTKIKATDYFRNGLRKYA
ncbi:hypothetical protein J0S82_011513, partial [Galemys pyrenaicus]